MRIIVLLQALYYLLTGLWPIFSIATFEAVTGPKTDDWLVRMVGALAATIGTTLLVASLRSSPNRESLMLAILSAISFAAIDIVYTLNGTISRIYLVDAVIQVVIISALLVAPLLRRKRSRSE
jgi:hypothetical protein